MGRQIHFHMLPEDRRAFLSFARQHDPVEIVLRDGDSPEVQSVPDINMDGGKTLCLWNRKILPSFKREWVPDPGYYRVDGLRTPTLELTSSFAATWEGKPALGQGRLFGDFDSYLGKSPEFEKWYETLARWIRTNYEKNPTGTSGYVGPAAYDFYSGGAYLLPQFLPPRTEVWLTEIGKQHAQVKGASPARKKARIRRARRKPEDRRDAF
jgi:hypothetical protein